MPAPRPSTVHTPPPASAWAVRAADPHAPKRVNEAVLDDLLENGTWSQWVQALHERPKRDVQEALMNATVVIAFWRALVHEGGILVEAQTVEQRWAQLDHPERPLSVRPLQVARVFYKEPAWRAVWEDVLTQAIQAPQTQRATWTALLDRMTDQGARWKTVLGLHRQPLVSGMSTEERRSMLEDGVQGLTRAGYPELDLVRWRQAKAQQLNVGLSMQGSHEDKVYASVKPPVAPKRGSQASTSTPLDPAPSRSQSEALETQSASLDSVWNEGETKRSRLGRRK